MEQYRVVKVDGEKLVREVFFDENGNPYGYSDPVRVDCQSLDDLYWMIAVIKKARELPLIEQTPDGIKIKGHLTK